MYGLLNIAQLYADNGKKIQIQMYAVVFEAIKLFGFFFFFFSYKVYLVKGKNDS